MAVDPRSKSRVLLEGTDRSAARAMMKAVGFSDEDLKRPQIGVAHSWIGTMPCNWNHRKLAEKVMQGVRAAGGTPIEVNTISITDGITMGTEGMKGSLISREVIADSVELVARSHMFDGLVTISGCDKTIPAMAMVLGRVNVPGLMLYCGSIMFGRCVGTTGPFANRNLTIQDVFEAIGAYNAGKISHEEFMDVEDHACPGAGACGGQFTANTMATAYEMLGISPMGWNDVPAVDPRKEEIAFECGKMVMGLVKKGITPRSIVTRKSFENAIAGVMATGGSTNAVLHLPATAKDFGVKLSIDGLRSHLEEDAGGGGPQAMGHLHRARDVRGRRHGGGGQAARPGGAHSRRGANGDGPDDRRRDQARGRAGGPDGHQAARPRRSSRRGASPSCAAIWRPAAA